MISFGEWGGPGGDHWSSKATNGITEITITEETNIKSFSFTDASGEFSGTFGSNYLGEERKISINWPSEYLVSISGTYGEYGDLQVILSLSFITNLTTYGPFGSPDSDQAFSIPIANSVVVGFHGRSGRFLDAIGIYVQPVHPRESVSVGPWGGSGGNPFTFQVDPSYIKQIMVGQGENIKSISFKDADDREYGPFGGQNSNDPGVEEIIEIGNSRLTSISGTYGTFAGITVITSLSFLINNTINGPYGTETGTSFSIPIQGSEVIGFFGKSGYYLDSIGLYVKASVAQEL